MADIMTIVVETPTVIAFRVGAAIIHFQRLLDFTVAIAIQIALCGKSGRGMGAHSLYRHNGHRQCDHCQDDYAHQAQRQSLVFLQAGGHQFGQTYGMQQTARHARGKRVAHASQEWYTRP